MVDSALTDPILRQGSIQKILAIPLLPRPPSRYRSVTAIKPASGRLTKIEATFNMLNLTVGSGILAMPYAMRVAGGLLGGVTVLLAGAALAVSGVLVGWCLELAADDFEAKGLRREMRDFAALAGVAFGPVGKTVVRWCAALECWFNCEGYLILLGLNISLVFPITPKAATLIAGVAAFFMEQVPDRIYAYVSLIGFVAATLAVVLLIGTGMLLEAQDEQQYWEHRQLVNWDGASTGVGIVLVSLASHPGLPSVYARMKHPDEEYCDAAMACFVTSTILYVITAMCGWHFFGNFAGEAFTMNLGVDLNGMVIPGMGSWQRLACLAFILKLQAVVPLAMRPVLTTIECSMNDIASSNAHNGQHLFRRVPQLHLISKVVLFTVSIWIAIRFAEHLDVVLGVSGCLFAMVCAVIAPFSMYLAMAGKSAGLLAWMVLSACIAVAVIVAVLGTQRELSKLL